MGRRHWHAVSPIARHSTERAAGLVYRRGDIMVNNLVVNPSPSSNARQSLAVGDADWQPTRFCGTNIWRHDVACRSATLILLIIANLLFVLVGPPVRSEIVAGLFFATGALVLLLIFGAINRRMRGSRLAAGQQHGLSIAGLSARNISRNSGRSTLTIGLVSAASFLIVAISAFRFGTSDKGTGGFDLIATSDQPIHHDLNTPEGRLELGFSDDASDQLADRHVFSLRVADGEDASCLNLYRPAQPRVLGVPEALFEHTGFAWTDDENSGRPEGRTESSRWQNYPWGRLRGSRARCYRSANCAGCPRRQHGSVQLAFEGSWFAPDYSRCGQPADHARSRWPFEKQRAARGSPHQREQLSPPVSRHGWISVFLD